MIEEVQVGIAGQRVQCVKCLLALLTFISAY